MTVSATEIFESIAAHEEYRAERHEVFSAGFSRLRSFMRRMIESLRETDDPEANEAANHLQRAISEWLTMPVPFDSTITQRLQFLGIPEAFTRRWGNEMGSLYQSALDEARMLADNGNPLRIVLAETVRMLQKQGNDFRVFCHRTAVPLYISLFRQSDEDPLPASAFLHSCRGYRDVEPFDVLVKLGPLRSRGWGSVPDAILTAPRFTTLLQIVWSGCNDEADFGYDPAAAISRPAAQPVDAKDLKSTRSTFGFNWERKSYRLGEVNEASNSGISDVDEFQLFKDLRHEQAQDDRRAVFVQFDDEHGIFYPPLSRVLCFDPEGSDDNCIGYRVPGETLSEGIYILRPVLQETGTGGLQAQHGRFSQIWKERLRKRFQENPASLIRELDAAELQLLRLDLAILHWMKAPTTVIHAPQQKRHFEILVRVLGADFTPVAPTYFRGRPLWEYAWNEVCQSRGEAIHAGVVSHSQAEDYLSSILRQMLAEIRSSAQQGANFSIVLPPGGAISGTVLFDRVRAVEEGFRVPSAELHRVHDLDEVEQWRV